MSLGSQLLTLMIVPGLEGSGPNHWQTLWEKQFPGVVRVDLKKIDETIQMTKGPIVIAAHGQGCLAVVQWAGQKNNGLDKIAGALLVGFPDGKEPLILEKLPFKSILVASSNDPHCPVEKSRVFAAQLGSEWVNIGNKGHIDTGLGDWEEGKKLLDQLTI